MAKILVAGAGHGGLSAAFNLASQGQDVTVYEKHKEDELGHDWQDFFDFKCLSYAGFPMPEEGLVNRYSMNMIFSFDPYINLQQKPLEDAFELYLYRSEIYAHLIKSCKEAGVKFCFEAEVEDIIMLGNRVCGIKVGGEAIYGDLVIDATGMYSTLQPKIPNYLSFDNWYSGCEIIHVYRAYFNRLKDAPDPGRPVYDVVFPSDGNSGLEWVKLNEDTVDILIGRLGNTSEEIVAGRLAELRKNYPFIGDEIVHGGIFCDIPIRQPISVLVANGFAAVGDSACMTMPMMGSGIANSIKAGKMLADAVAADVNGEFSAEKLWAFQKRYYKEIGFSCCNVALFKVFINSMKTEELQFFITQKLLSADDINFTTEGSGFFSKLIAGGLDPRELLTKAKKLRTNPALIGKLTAFVSNMIKMQGITAIMPQRYSEAAAASWAQKYNSFFSAISNEGSID